MSSTVPNQSEGVYSNPAATDLNSLALSLRPMSPYPRIFDNNQEAFNLSCNVQRITYEDVETIVYQLQENLIETMRMVPPSRCQTCDSSSYDASTESRIESAIRDCVKSALETWTRGYETNTSSHTDMHITDSHDSHQYLRSEMTAQSSGIFSDITETQSELSDTLPAVSNLCHNRSIDVSLTELPRSIESTCSEPSHMPPNLSLDMDQDKSESRVFNASNNKDWKKHRSILEHLYMVENKPLAEVRSFMAEQHNFNPTPKQYRYQFGVKWGWKKYNANPSPQRHADPFPISFSTDEAMLKTNRKKRKMLGCLDVYGSAKDISW
ncbi:Clr5 domain-containing protein [Xylaria arbuscula]|nr:Clr5 domain-containing protein [Xylaria arbuscula]